MWAARFNYFTLILLIIFGMLFYNNYALFFLLIILIALPVISYVIMRFGRNRIEVDISTDKTSVGKNVPVDVCFDVKNKSILPIENLTLVVKIYNHFYGNEQVYEIIVPSTPFSRRKAFLDVDNIYCGRMIIEVTELKGYDLFGMFRFILPVNEMSEVMVMPYETISIEELPLATQGSSDDEELQYKKGDDVSQISQIRNYIPGDRLQNIHWKLSAKSDELQVKEFSLSYSDDVILLTELYINRDMPEIFDELIEKVFAISVFLIKQGRRFYLSWYDSANEEFINNEINNDDELMRAVIDLYFAKTLETNGKSYEIYRRINNDNKGTVIYLSDEEAKPGEGQNIDISSERVVLTCLY